MSLDVYLRIDVSALSGSSEPHEVELYDDNITHNLGKMAGEFGLYVPLWRPDEANINEAWQLIDLLVDGLEALESQPDRAKAHNPPNGWGDYEGLVGFVERYLEACRKYPKAKVKVSR